MIHENQMSCLPLLGCPGCPVFWDPLQGPRFGMLVRAGTGHWLWVTAVSGWRYASGGHAGFEFMR